MYTHIMHLSLLSLSNPLWRTLSQNFCPGAFDCTIFFIQKVKEFISFLQCSHIIWGFNQYSCSPMGRELDFLKSLIPTNSPIMPEVELIGVLYSDQVIVRKAIQILDG